MGLTSDKDINKLINKLIDMKIREGWTAKIGKHIKLCHPERGFVSIAKSTSCRYALQNIKGDIARLEKNKRLGLGNGRS